MTLAALLSAYAALNLAIAAAVTGLISVELLAARLSARTLLRMHYGIAVVVVASVILCSVLPDEHLPRPSLHVWSSQALHTVSTGAEPAGAFISAGEGTNLDAGSVSRVWIAVALMLLAFGIFRALRDYQSLRALRRDSQCVRRHGRVRLWFSDHVRVPLSYWLPGAAHVVVPSGLIEDPHVVRMVVAHELQHHRQRDTVWLHFFRVLTWLCFLNPFAHLWNRRLGRMQEFSCDEALAARGAWSIADYARCLVDIAGRERHGASRHAWATHFIRFGDPNVLIRRIEKMLEYKQRNWTKPLQAALLCTLAAIVTISAYAATGSVQDRRVTREQAIEMAARFSGESGFRVVVNDEVLHEINRYAGTPEGREYMRASLQRFDAHRAAVTATLARHGVPTELAALPLIESGYQNLDATKNRLSGAGIWQFLPETARVFGLTVKGDTDERLDVARLTDAAARMLRSSQLRFDDWQLAVLAFNAGASGVQGGIENTGSRDAWTLVRAGHGNDPGYLARVHAAVLIAANPAVVSP